MESYESIVTYLQQVTAVQLRLVSESPLGEVYEYSLLLQPLREFVRVKLERNNHTYQALIFVINVYYFIN